MSKRNLKKLVAAGLASGMLMASGIVSFAAVTASIQQSYSGYAGTVRVEGEIGYNDRNAYIEMKASDYVDGTIKMGGTYRSSGADLPFSGTYPVNNRTYYQAEQNLEGFVQNMTGSVSVYSNDGNYSYNSGRL